MLLSIIILSILLTLLLIFSLFCYMHYHLQRKDFEAYQRMAESNQKLWEMQYDYTCELLDELKKVGTEIINSKKL